MATGGVRGENASGLVSTRQQAGSGRERSRRNGRIRIRIRIRTKFHTAVVFGRRPVAKLLRLGEHTASWQYARSNSVPVSASF